MNNNLILNSINVVIILGQKLKDDGTMQNSLIHRLELANQVFHNIKQQENAAKIPSSTFVIVSGKGIKGVEADIMAEYLKETHQYSEQIIARETKSMTTSQNFVFIFFELWKILERGTNPSLQFGKSLKNVILHIVTSDFHLERSQSLCQSVYFKVQKAFKNHTFLMNKTKYYGSRTNKVENVKEQIRLSTHELFWMLDHLNNYKMFAQEMGMNKEDQMLLQEFSEVIKSSNEAKCNLI